MSKQNILRSAAFLTLSGIIAKTIDFLFRAYYSKQLGSEGMGIFSLVFSFHGIMLTVATGGLGVAVSKTVSLQFTHREFGNINKTMNIAISSVFVLSTLVISAVYIFSEQISAGFLKEPRTKTSIILLSPSILFMGISYCIKGYFYASRKISIPASSEFLEQAVKITSTTILLKNLLPYGISHGCEAVFLGITLGEFSSCLYLSLFYLKFRSRCTSSQNTAKVLSSLMRIALPAMTTSLMGSFLRMQENVLIISALKKSGLDHSQALSSYGVLHGMVMPLITFPLTLLSSCFTLLVPEISRADGMQSRLRIKTLVSRIYRFTALGGFLVCTVFIIFSGELASLVYAAPHIAPSVRIIALFSPVMFLDSVSCGILNGLGKQSALLRFSLSDSALRLFLIAFLVPRMGANALFIVIAISNLFTASLTLGTAVKSTKTPFELSGWLLRHILSAFATFITVNSLSVFFSYSKNNISTIIAIAFAAATYILYSSCLCKTLRSDISWLAGRMFFNT